MTTSNTNISSSPEANRPLRVLVSGGGTGGHIFPALSIANALKRRNPNTEILFVGAENRMEMERVPAAGYDIVGLPVAGFDRKRLWRNVGVLIKAWRSMRRAARVIKDFKPDVAVGVGGYASGPTLKMAQRRGIPTLLQEQNSYAGVTNKLLARKAKAICVAYDDMGRFFPQDVITLTGNPVRASLLESTLSRSEAKALLGFNPERPLILVLGGSLGARTINEAVALALPSLTEKGYSVMWQTGRLYADRFTPLAADYNGVKATAFIDKMDVAYRAADIVVSRAGAGTISELQLLGKASVLIPSPNVAEDHQRRNAEALSSRGAAVMIADAEASEKLGAEVLRLLAEPEQIAAIEAEAAKMALPNADEHIVDHIYEIANQND